MPHVPWPLICELMKGLSVLKITGTDYERILKHCRDEYPNEACGILAGHNGTVEKIYLMKNAEPSPSFYIMEPQEQFRVMKEMRQAGLNLVGIYHSHTGSQAYPSATDVSLAYYPEAVYLIAAPELPSIRNLVRYMDHLKRFNCPLEKARVVINRYDKRSAIREDQIEKTIRRPISFLVPNSYNEVVSAINSGTPISTNAKTELAAMLRRWVGTLAEGAEPVAVKQEPKRRLGILGL